MCLLYDKQVANRTRPLSFYVKKINLLFWDKGLNFFRRKWSDHFFWKKKRDQFWITIARLNIHLEQL